MSRARIILTLILVAAAAMLVGLAVSTLIDRRLAPPPDSRPEVIDPQRSHTGSHVIVEV